jgi:hypothetical protein
MKLRISDHAAICECEGAFLPLSTNKRDALTANILRPTVSRTLKLFHHSNLITRSHNQDMCISGSTSAADAIDLKSPEAVTEKRTNNKHLTFAPQLAQVVNTGISLEDYSREELDSSWWSADEFKNMSDDAKYIMRALREYGGPTCIELLDVSYRRSKRFANRLDGKGIDALLQDPSHYTSELELWTSRGDGCRGIEKYSSNFQRAERITGAQKMVAMVVGTRRAGSFSNDEIAEIYAEQSRADLIFARLMAAADYLTAYSLPV